METSRPRCGTDTAKCLSSGSTVSVCDCLDRYSGLHRLPEVNIHRHHIRRLELPLDPIAWRTIAYDRTIHPPRHAFCHFAVVARKSLRAPPNGLGLANDTRVLLADHDQHTQPSCDILFKLDPSKSCGIRPPRHLLTKRDQNTS